MQKAIGIDLDGVIRHNNKSLNTGVEAGIKRGDKMESFLICDDSDEGLLVRNGKLIAFREHSMCLLYIANILPGLYSVIRFEPNNIEKALGEEMEFEYFDNEIREAAKEVAYA